MEVLIMVGPPGSGKSTFIEKLKFEGKKVAVCSADHTFIDHTGVYNYDPAKLGDAHKNCYTQYLWTLQHAANVYADPRRLDYIVVDNTNLNIQDITPYTMLAAVFNTPFKIVKFNVDPEVAAARNVHGVPKEKVMQMAERLKYLHFPKHWTVEVVNGN